MTIFEQNENNDDKWWIAALVVLMLLWLAAWFNPLRAQEKDTIPCKVECIKSYLSRQTPKTTHHYVVYKDSTLEEIIPISKSVKDYVEMCKQNGIRPSLGIYLKNGQIMSVVRYKKRYICSK